MSNPVEILNVFTTLTLKQVFWKTKTYFKKLESRFLVESANIENASFPYKTVMSEANVKTNRMVSTNWTYHKERSFASNYFIFLKILLQLKGNVQLVQKVTFEPLVDFKQNYYGSWKYQKSCYFQKFSSPKL